MTLGVRITRYGLVLTVGLAGLPVQHGPHRVSAVPCRVAPLGRLSAASSYV